MPLFFISYKREDQAFARKVKKIIEEQKDEDFLAWIDLYDLSAGDEWKKAIDTAIKEAIGVIVIVTPESIQSPYVTYEWSYAMGMGKRIIPILLREPTPEQTQIHEKIKDLHMLYFTSQNEHEQDWAGLKNQLHQLAEQYDVPPAIKNMMRAIYENVYDKHKWQNILKSLLKYQHESGKEALAELMIAKLPNISLQAALFLAERTNHTDERVLYTIQKMIEDKDEELYERDDEISKTISLYNNEKALETLINLAKHLEQGYPNHNLTEIYLSISRISTSKILPHLSKYLKQNLTRQNYLYEYQYRMLLIMVTGHGKNSLLYISDLINTLEQTVSDYKYFLGKFISKLKTVKFNGFEDEYHQYDPETVNAILEALDE